MLDCLMEENYNDLISVIVPVYNVEEYLSECIESLINQTYTNIEIILVNDGSTDRSGEICDEYAQLDDRIKVIHKINGGVSSARNLGMDVASGNYFGFADSDDQCKANMYEILLNNAKENRSDVSVCGFTQASDDICVDTQNGKNTIKIYNHEDAKNELLCGNPFGTSLCNKIYKADIIGDIRLSENLIYAEDLKFNYDILGKSNKMVIDNRSLYLYRQRHDSVVHKFTSKHMSDCFEVLEYIYKNEEDNEKNLMIFCTGYIFHIRNVIYKAVDCKLILDRTYRIILKTLKQRKNIFEPNIKDDRLHKDLLLFCNGMRVYEIKRYLFLVLRHVYRKLVKDFACINKIKRKMFHKKIAVVTQYGENNYGNRLQNYAVHKVLENLGYNVQSIVKGNDIKWINKLAYFVMQKTCLFAPRLALKRWNEYIIRTVHFRCFTKKHIETRYITDFHHDVFPDTLQKEYDYFVVGSDQVWNPTICEYEKEYGNMFLTFASKNQRVCFSPSIGVTMLQSEWIEKFKDGFDGFNYLSVREESGAKIIKEISGRDAQVLIDPTLMLDKEEWLKVSKKSKAPKKPYVLEYFLGERDNEKLNAIAKDNNLSRVTLLDRNNPDIYVSGPGEFIDLVSKADMVCTDSFHACVFSILFGKPFIVYKRNDNIKDMYSRIDTLLKMFNVEASEMPIIVTQEVRDNVLKIERKKVIDFLKRNLNYEN